MQKTITLKTDKQNGLYDITAEVVSIISQSNVKTGLASIYARGSTGAIMIQENWDKSVQNDVVKLLRKLIPSGVWEHTNKTSVARVFCNSLDAVHESAVRSPTNC